MKRLLALLTLALAIVSCSKADEAPLSVSLDKSSIKISATTTDAIEYTASGYSGSVTVSLTSIVSDVTIQNSFDAATGKGEVTFSTQNVNKVHYDVPLVFKDSKGECQEDISIDISSTWSIIPD